MALIRPSIGLSLSGAGLGRAVGRRDSPWKGGAREERREVGKGPFEHGGPAFLGVAADMRCEDRIRRCHQVARPLRRRSEQHTSELKSIIRRAYGIISLY